MSQLYFDNAATSWPKPPEVLLAMQTYMAQSGLTYGRTAGVNASLVGRQISQLRHWVAGMIGASAQEIAFTYNATDALNLAINGIVIAAMRQGKLRSGAAAKFPLRVITSQIEHNSVLRPLNYWQQHGKVDVQTVPCDRLGRIDIGRLLEMADESTALVCLSHASNVTGMVQDAEAVGKHCERHGIAFLLDAAQTMGHIPVDINRIRCDFLVSAGHKALLGPLGTGILYVRQDIEPFVDCLRSGGTGTQSHLPLPATNSPEKWEAGSLNVGGLLGLAAGIEVLQSGGLQRHYQHANHLCSQIWKLLLAVPEVNLVADDGSGDPFSQLGQRMPVISLTSQVLEPNECSLAIESAGGLVTRSGYHCAPLIHNALGTTNGGTLRISPGAFNDTQQIETLVECLKAVLQF